MIFIIYLLFVSKILNYLLLTLTHNFYLKYFTTFQYKYLCTYKLKSLTYSRLWTTTTDRASDGFSRKYSGR